MSGRLKEFQEWVKGFGARIGGMKQIDGRETRVTELDAYIDLEHRELIGKIGHDFLNSVTEARRVNPKLAIELPSPEEMRFVALTVSAGRWGERNREEFTFALPMIRVRMPRNGLKLGIEPNWGFEGNGDGWKRGGSNIAVSIWPDGCLSLWGGLVKHENELNPRRVDPSVVGGLWLAGLETQTRTLPRLEIPRLYEPWKEVSKSLLLFEHNKGTSIWETLSVGGLWVRANFVSLKPLLADERTGCVTPDMISELQTLIGQLEDNQYPERMENIGKSKG